MQIAVVSNLHGNLPALESIISELQSLKEHGREIERIYIVGVLGFMPYPRGVYERIEKSDYLVPVKGKYDHLISTYHELDESSLNELKDVLPQFVVDMVEWNRDVIGKEGRNWLHYVPSYVTEKFGENEFFFVYGDIFKQVEEPGVFEQGELKAKMPGSYYQSFLEPLKKYEVVLVGGRSHYVAETRYGKIICPGSAGLKPTRDGGPHFAVIDTVNTDVSFFEFNFKKTNTYKKIKELKLPGDITDLLYHGYQSYKGL
ncbi:MAG: hypothetical protein R6U44_01625 [Archaeoglobaceae archaeon]